MALEFGGSNEKNKTRTVSRFIDYTKDIRNNIEKGLYKLTNLN